MAPSSARQSIKTFFLELENSDAITILDATAERFRQGLELYDQRPDKGWSLTDCISFVAMKEHALIDALTGDHHFAQAGFRPLFA